MKRFTPPHQSAHVAPNTSVLLALSGGADSRALLHLLAQDAGRHGYALHLAHVHHGIREGEADRDETFCRELAAAYGCPIHVLHTDVPAIVAQTGESPEMAGRRVRYAYFAELMQEHHIPLLATAHHADDNMETVLLRLADGSSSTGLCGIAPAHPFAGGTLVRPLLGVTRRDILAYCEKNHLTYVTDSTNADTAYARNRVRAEIIPAMEHIVPHPQMQILRTCYTLREDDDYLFTLARDLHTKARLPDGSLRLDVLQGAPPPLLRRALLLALREQTAPPTHRLQLCHLDALSQLVARARGMTDLPGDLRATADGHTLRWSQKSAQAPPVASLFLPLTEGTHHLPQLGITLTLTADLPFTATFSCRNDAQSEKFLKNPQNVYNPFIHDTLTFDTIMKGAYFRLRKEGDLLLLRGMHRKVRKLQNAAGIPPALRERVPLLCDEAGVVWVPFVGARDDVSTKDKSAPRYTLHLSVGETE
ncbi:MAG: tRNA lysidine(34) synthetase TilS [Clostridia bacterium]|nr:tRNA lysidine(34) synthetase TilS [Clostridia bacterium]MBQ7339121.1 tRNA lysidine(34) synthetase TilS [Clostridia bacterium]